MNSGGRTRLCQSSHAIDGDDRKLQRSPKKHVALAVASGSRALMFSCSHALVLSCSHALMLSCYHTDTYTDTNTDADAGTITDTNTNTDTGNQ